MIIDGRAIARDMRANIKARSERLPRRPRVVAYVAQEPTPATISYLKIKARSAEESGCDFVETDNPELFATADAVIVQLPTSPEAMALLDQIPIGKDADVLSKKAREKFERGDAGALLPPVAAAVREIFQRYLVEVRGKKAVVIGSGFLVGAPVAMWLSQQGADVALLSKESDDTAAMLRIADIVISGAGVPHLITPDQIREGVVLIDAGTSESNGEVAGDADPSCAAKCSLFTPVPGGVGPLAVACLFENAVTLAERYQCGG